MTPEEEREHLRAQLEQYGQGVLQEWMRIIELDTPDIALTGQARVRWQNDSGECIIGETQYSDEYGHFRLTVTAVDLGPMPPIGPEDDLGVHGIGQGSGAATTDEGAGEVWVERTFADVRAGDRIRLGSGAPEARITARYLHPSEDPAGCTWHVVPSGEVGPWAHKSDMVVQPGEVVLCSPDINAGQPYRFKPDVPVEIWLPDRATLRAVEAWGWSKRLDHPTRDWWS